VTLMAYNSTAVPPVDLRSLQKTNRKPHIASQLPDATQPSACFFDNRKCLSHLLTGTRYSDAAITDIRVLSDKDFPPELPLLNTVHRVTVT